MSAKPKPIGAETTVKTPPKQLTPWVKGQSGNPRGRPRGARTKLAEDFMGDILSVWEVSGKAAVEHMAANDPSKFVQCVASLMPKELNVTTTPVEELTDDELATALAALRSISALTNTRSGDETAARH